MQGCLEPCWEQLSDGHLPRGWWGHRAGQPAPPGTLSSGLWNKDPLSGILITARQNISGNCALLISPKTLLKNICIFKNIYYKTSKSCLIRSKLSSLVIRKDAEIYFTNVYFPPSHVYNIIEITTIGAGLSRALLRATIWRSSAQRLVRSPGRSTCSPTRQPVLRSLKQRSSPRYFDYSWQNLSGNWALLIS